MESLVSSARALNSATYAVVSLDVRLNRRAQHEASFLNAVAGELFIDAQPSDCIDGCQYRPVSMYIENLQRV